MAKKRIYIVIDRDGCAEGYSNLTKAINHNRQLEYYHVYRLLVKSDVAEIEGIKIYKVILK